MKTTRFVTLSRLITAVGFVLASAAAQAGGNVYWSVNVDAPTHGNGRVSTSFSNSRHGVGAGYREPVVYAPAPVVIHAPGRVYYDDHRPRWHHRHHRHYHRHHHRHGARVASRVHGGLARMHQDLANFHGARSEAWANARRGWRDGYRHDGYRHDGYRRGGYDH